MAVRLLMLGVLRESSSCSALCARLVRVSVYDNHSILAPLALHWDASEGLGARRQGPAVQELVGARWVFFRTTVCRVAPNILSELAYILYLPIQGHA